MNPIYSSGPRGNLIRISYTCDREIPSLTMENFGITRTYVARECVVDPFFLNFLSLSLSLSLPLLWTKRIENAGESDKKQLPRTTVTVLNGDVFRPVLFATSIDEQRLETLRVRLTARKVQKRKRERERDISLCNILLSMPFCTRRSNSYVLQSFLILLNTWTVVKIWTNSLSNKNS